MNKSAGQRLEKTDFFRELLVSCQRFRLGDDGREAGEGGDFNVNIPPC